MSKIVMNGKEYNSISELMKSSSKECNIVRKNILNDVKEDNVALKYLFKYMPDVITDDLLEEIIDANKYAVRYVPRERLSRKIVMSVVTFKDSRCLFNYIPKELIDEDMEEIIITTYTYEGIKRYLKVFEDELTIEKVKKIIIYREKKVHKIFLKDRIPEKFLVDEVLELIPEE